MISYCVISFKAALFHGICMDCQKPIKNKHFVLMFKTCLPFVLNRISYLVTPS